MQGKTNDIITWLLHQDKETIFEIKEFREKRSLNANSYAWVLIGKLSEVIKLSSLEIYKRYIKELGICKQIEISENAASTFETSWGMNGIGWICERLDYAKTEGFVLINAYYGSSTYNSKQMARFIDYIVQDCKAQEIETLDDTRLSQMIDKWERK